MEIVGGGGRRNEAKNIIIGREIFKPTVRRTPWKYWRQEENRQFKMEM